MGTKVVVDMAENKQLASADLLEAAEGVELLGSHCCWSTTEGDSLMNYQEPSWQRIYFL